MIAPIGEPDPTDKPLLFLHLEDSAADQRLAQITLQRAGLACHMVCVDTLADFLTQLQAQTYDLVLADYYLPGFTAMDAWAAARHLPQCPPFVLLSGAIGETAAVEAIRQGIADYLLKDNMARLPHVLSRALEVHEARRAKAQARRELERSERQLAELTEHLQQSIEQERAAIAREIHDDIGGSLTSVKFDLAWIDRNATEHQVRNHAQAALEMLQHALGASQRIMMNLRPPVLDQGLVAAVQWLAENFERRTGVLTRVDAPASIEVTPEIQVVAYRTAQEALTNVGKYAQASAVHLELSNAEGFLTLEVRDNGCGMAAGQRDKPKAFGLRGLAERARTVGGWLDVSSQVGRGTSIIVSIPLP
ncbi:histidine kinase [Comamonas aquatica]|uniref:hybrid sensor histidine kinase/response regulator n=1 Tax=Comamonas aquatica TaxID=225991 RepID=UPI00244D378F|nr:histidine kinase [Comamonas aquatica]MDH0900993.1 histidine kinase [Comamonas aquatica]